VRAREAAGLPEDLVLYCARHDYGSYVLQTTGNLKVIMDTMGQHDVRSALVSAPQVEVAREVINARHTAKTDEQANA